jgi:lipopolysaccharide biosynthesis glycosyltransferase
MPDKKTINIMTSCDDSLSLYIMPQLASIGVSLKAYGVNFYLFHSRIKPENVLALRRYAETIGNVSFNEIRITDTAPYETIAERGGPFPFEAYFALCCHEYLPSDADRVLYIDAGDAVINGDVAPFYFDGFDGLSLIATLGKFAADDVKPGAKDGLNELSRTLGMFNAAQTAGSDPSRDLSVVRPFSREDLGDPDKLDLMLESGIFTSGCYMINLAQFRADGRSMNDYLYLQGVLAERFPDRERIYFGDQGFMSAAFAGDIKYLGWPDSFKLGYAPYNFGVWFLEGGGDPGYEPVIPHYAGVNYMKPWQARFSPEAIGKYRFDKDPDNIHVPFRLNARQAELYELWWRYCAMTPVYEELNERASVAARALEENYLPLCGWYNELADDYFRLTGKKPPGPLDPKT